MKIKNITVLIIVLLLAVIALESYLQTKYGPITVEEEEQPFFKYAYEDINKKLYKKVFKNEKYMYVSQRQYYENYAEFSAKKDNDVIRLFIIGGSVAHGWEDPMSIPSDFITGKKLEIINVGMPGYDSYRVKLIARELLQYEPDLIVVLSGNNEYFPKQGFNPIAYSLNKFLTRFYFYNDLQKKIFRSRFKDRNPFERNLGKDLERYENNIRDIVRNIQKKGVSVILCTLPINMKGSISARPVPVNKQILLGKLLIEDKKFYEAIEVLRDFIKKTDDNLYGYYYLAKAYEQIEDYKSAKENYLFSVEAAADDFATPSKNMKIRNISKEEKVALIDLESIFINFAKQNITDREIFADHCHLWDEYYRLFDNALLKEIFKKDSKYLNKTDLEKNKSKQQYFSDQFKPPSLKEFGKIQENVNRIIGYAGFYSIENNNISERALYSFETLYLMDPGLLSNMRFLKENIRELLEQNQYISEDASDKKIFDSKWKQILYHIGETYRRMNMLEEALDYFNKAIALNDTYYLPYLGRTLVYYSLENKE
ncbi:MAG: tetratricopeptide repeat protein, partial [Candidatus Omnitrophica bacterium]|nr:tetratricopeptide repeat protein [Candidatus Omnitrophota bacterium]